MADPKRPDAHRDPLTGAPGAHPVGVGAGAASAGAAGAAVGALIGGPAGAALGAAVGAVAGGLAGKGAAEAVNPTVEDDYWRKNYSSLPYASSGSYDEFRPAFEYGWESYSRYRGRQFDDVEPDLRREWEKGRKNAGLGWDEARRAARDAWDRVERARPEDSDQDKR
jgi:hypothetical protein